MQPDVNLIFLCGTNASGKTRMLQGIEQLLPEAQVLRVGAETMVGDLVEEIRNWQSLNSQLGCYGGIDDRMLPELSVIWCNPEWPLVASRSLPPT
jgi:energy-coupling factor transporter ATP-binding protein EcfA2